MTLPSGQRSEALHTVAVEAAGCRACDLWEPATQTVFGAGPPDAGIMLVGEQPGDREDLDGAPFVGPAGRVLDDAWCSWARSPCDRCWVDLPPSPPSGAPDSTSVTPTAW